MTGFKSGDRVVYAGLKFPQLWDMELTVDKIVSTYCVNCRFPEPDRPGGYGLTTWLNPNDLIAAEV